MVDTFTSSLKSLSRRKITVSPGDGGHIFQKPLSVVDITCAGLSSILGIGVYTILAFAAKEKSGPSIVLSFLISSVASCLGGLCYSELATRFPKAGSAYCYVYATLGELPAFLIGWSQLLEYHFVAALAAKSWVQYINGLSNRTTMTSIRLESTALANEDESRHIYLDFLSPIVILCAGVLITRSLKISCIFNNVLIFICLLVIGAIVLTCLFEIDAENWIAGPGFFPFGLSGIFSGASICFFAFNGYDIIGLMSAESENRSRIVPVGISLTFLLGLLACFSSSVAITLLVPFSLLENNAPLLQAFISKNLDGINYFVILGATCGLISSLILSLLMLSRLLFSLANDGLLFSCLTKYDIKSGTTKRATVLSCLICGITSVCFETETILKLIGTGTILSYMCVAVAVLSLRYGVREHLPFEHQCELLSRESTCNDLQTHSQRISHSISDYYMNKTHNHNNIISYVNNNAENCLNDAFSNSNYNLQNTYGSCIQTNPRTLSVEFKNHSYITSLSDSSLSMIQQPTEQTSTTVAKITVSMMIVMLLMGILTIHAPRLLLDGNEWWMELTTTTLFIIICICIVLIIRKPRHSCKLRNSIPCVPLLPIFAIWLNIHLIVCLPYTSWLAFLIWSLLGIFVYLSYGVWNSKESSRCISPINDFGLTDQTSDDGEDIICFVEEIQGSQV